jgi:alpha-glucoside transport system substrate-binding protein
MNKVRNLLMLLLMASLLVTACAPQATEAPMTEAPMTEAPVATEAPAEQDAMCMGAQPGDELSLLYQWSGQEEERLNQILQPLVETCGIVLQPESTRDQALLDTRVQAGTPPDIAFWNVTQLQQYKDQLIPMDTLGASQDAYIPGAIDSGVIDGTWVGLPVKSDIKTVIWYSPINFEAFGYQVPATWEELDALVEQMVADGNVPWSMGLESGDATGWTGSDFIQDILLVQQGPEYVNGLISGDISYGKWAKDPKYTVGGADGTLSTSFLDAIYKPFSDPAEAMMVKQSGFAGGEIVKVFPDLQLGTDYDFFVVPGAQGLQGGSDWMMAFSDKPAVHALVAYLSSPEGGANWAKAGFGLSPNRGAEGNFSDPSLAKQAEAFYTTQGLTPDIGDNIPGGFGSAEWTAIIDFLNGGDLAAALAQAAEVQRQALAQ